MHVVVVDIVFIQVSFPLFHPEKRKETGKKAFFFFRPFVCFACNFSFLSKQVAVPAWLGSRQYFII